MSRDLLMTLEC